MEGGELAWCKVTGSPWWPAVAFDSWKQVDALDLDPPESLNTKCTDDIIVIFLGSYTFALGKRGDANFLQRYSEIAPTRVLEMAKKGSQRRDLVEAIRTADAFQGMQKGPRSRRWGGPGTAHLGWHRKGWALWEGGVEAFKVNRPDDDVDAFLRSITNQAASAHAKRSARLRKIPAAAAVAARTPGEVAPAKTASILPHSAKPADGGGRAAKTAAVAPPKAAAPMKAESASLPPVAPQARESKGAAASPISTPPPKWYAPLEGMSANPKAYSSIRSVLGVVREVNGRRRPPSLG